MKHLALAAVAFSAMMGAAACNGVIGSDDINLSDDDDGGTTTSGDPTSNGTDAGPTTTGQGGAGVGGAAATGVGGNASTNAGPGPATTTTTTNNTTGGQMCGGAGPGTTPLDSEEQAFVTLINNHRANNSLGPLTPCISLNRAAQGHSEDMRDQDYFSHTGLNNSSPWDRMCAACFDLACNSGTPMGENIAAGNSGAQATFNQWLNSPGHNANMLGSSFNFMGIGRATGGGTYGVYWTNVFAGDDEASCY